jgi:hypothetical protein
MLAMTVMQLYCAYWQVHFDMLNTTVPSISSAKDNNIGGSSRGNRALAATALLTLRNNISGSSRGSRAVAATAVLTLRFRSAERVIAILSTNLATLEADAAAADVVTTERPAQRSPQD